MGGGERGREGGGVDLNLGTPEPLLSATRSDNDPLFLSEAGISGEARRSEKEVFMNGCVEKVKVVGCELPEVSRLPEEDAMRIRKRNENREVEEGNESLRKRERGWF